jgi:putative membrane protein
MDDDSGHMLNNRAPFIIDLAMFLSVLAPLVTLLSITLVRKRRFQLHRSVQSWLILVCVTAVIALEVSIRLAGGSGAFVAQADERWRAAARMVLTPHITVAALTYALWAWLVAVSRRRFGSDLPGHFARVHRPLGWIVFSGLVFSAESAAGVYATIFVLR